MSLYQPDPVEISTRMRPGEWTEESLQDLVSLYELKIMEMGAPKEAVLTEVVRGDDGSVSVRVSWAEPGEAGSPGMETAP
ncbi:hypothetical protein [Arthrobacter sp. M4]|uniref:hypothetical protein n=1 Tax=Arthrobacter sp. M4 TaxID=218160 RepID=UPI001CDD5084|nr:hypothetical protein [Arthrobacter sp. M4]MCA4135021.1 hypothetical protein [Arthrobacter sp. M4]